MRPIADQPERPHSFQLLHGATSLPCSVSGTFGKVAETVRGVEGKAHCNWLGKGRAIAWWQTEKAKRPEAGHSDSCQRSGPTTPNLLRALIRTRGR